MSSSILSGWPAQVVAFSVADNEAVYVTVNEPSGVFRLVPPFRSAADWVPGAKAQGIDVSADEELVLYAVPTTAPVSLAAQVRYVRDGQYGTWRSTYEPCGGTVAAAAAAAMAAATVTLTPATQTPTETAGADGTAAAGADGATATATATATAAAEATATATMTAAEREAESVAAAAAAAVAAAAAAGPLFPRDVAVIDGGRALIVDSLSHSVLMQSEGAKGEVVFGAPCEQGSDARHLLNPRGAAVDRAGNVFITDTGNNRVVVLEAR